MLDLNALNNESKNNLLFATVRKSFNSFVKLAFKEIEGKEMHDGPHVDLLTRCIQLNNDTDELNKLIINIPPRYGKSIICTVAYSAWLIGKYPNKKIMIVSYGDQLVQDFLVKIKLIMDSKWYKAAFPDAKFIKNTENILRTTKGGEIRGVSAGAALTGFGADLIIVDDPMKAQDLSSALMRDKINKWFDQTLYSRMNNKKNAKMIIVMQRFHQNDLTGYILDKEIDYFSHVALPVFIEDKDGLTFTVLDKYKIKFPYGPIAPKIEDEEIINETKLTLDPFDFEAQYMQSPIPEAGNIIKRKWINYQDLSKINYDVGFMIWSWDVASTAGENSDYSVGTLWLFFENKKYLLDVVIVKLEFSNLLKCVQNLQNTKPANIIVIEKAGSGFALGNQLLSSGYKATGISPVDSKVDRAKFVCPHFHRKEVIISDHLEDILEFEDQVLGFPNAKHDDIVDSITQALSYHDQIQHKIRRRLYPNEYI